MKKLFYVIDFCSSGPELKIQGDSKKKSALGAFISLLIAFIMIFLVIYLGIDVVQKRRPNVIISNIAGKDPIYYELTSKEILFGWKLTNLDGLTLNYHGYLNVLVRNAIGVANSDPTSASPWEITMINIAEDTTTCDQIPDNTGRASNSLLTSYTCSKNLKLILGGYYNNAKYGRIDIIVSPCKGEDYCKTPEEIETYITQGMYLTVYFPNYSVNPKSLNEPITVSYTPTLVGISSSLYVLYQRFYKNLIIETDIGFLLEDYRTINSSIYNYDTIIYQSRDKGDDLAWYTHFITAHQIVYERNYLKVQDVAASVGGLFKIFWIAGILFMYPISTKGVDTEIMNQIYDFNEYNDTKSIADYDSKSINSKMSRSFYGKMKNNINKSPIKRPEEKEKEFNISGNVFAMSTHNNNNNNISSNINISKKSNKLIMSENKEVSTKADIKSSINNNNVSSHPYILTSNAGLNQSSMIQVNHKAKQNSNSILENINAKNASNVNNKLKSIESINKLNNVFENSDQAFRLQGKELGESHVNNANNEDAPNMSNPKLINSMNLNQSANRVRVEMMDYTFGKRLHNYRLRFSNCELLKYFCPIRKCKSKKHIYKLHQYNTCIEEVNQYSNFDYIIKKIKEIEFIKAIIFNREQAMAFNFFHKPLIGEKDQKFSKASNQIHHDQFEMSRSDQVNEITKYFVDITQRKQIEEYDAKILDLLDIQY